MPKMVHLTPYNMTYSKFAVNVDKVVAVMGGHKMTTVVIGEHTATVVESFEEVLQIIAGARLDVDDTFDAGC